MAEKKDFLEEAKDSLKETINDVLKEELLPGGEIHHLKKVRNVINLLTWESARIIDKLKKRRAVESFEEESDIHFPLFSKKIVVEEQVEVLSELEEGVGLALLGINFLKKETEKLIEFFEFYRIEEKHAVDREATGQPE